MPIPVATALGRRDRMWPAIALSALAHVCLVAWGVARRPPTPLDLEQKPIVAKLVRLGEKRPEQWLPRKDAAPVPAPPAPVPTAPVAPGPRAAPAAPTAKATPQKSPPPSANGRAGGTTLASVLSKVQRQVEDSRWGDPNGDPAGDSDEGSEGDRYLALVRSALQAAYVVPATISDRERMYLKATVVLLIEPSGRVADYRFEARSGNGAYDAALERAIKAARLPPPPVDMRDRFRRTGFGIKFSIL